MLLRELITEETKNEYFKRLVKTLKIKKLGEGAYASVFQHPVYHNVAVKFFQYDPMYMKFIKHCMKHPENPWLPKVVSVHKLDIDNAWYDRAEKDKKREMKEDGYLVFFQKLRKATAKEIKIAAQDIISDLPEKVFLNDDNAERGNFNFMFRRADVDDFYNFENEEWEVVARMTKRPEVKKLAQILVSVGAQDIHNGNVMMRDEGDRTQLVFTDPVAS